MSGSFHRLLGHFMEKLDPNRNTKSIFKPKSVYIVFEVTSTMDWATVLSDTHEAQTSNSSLPFSFSQMPPINFERLARENHKILALTEDVVDN